MVRIRDISLRFLLQNFHLKQILLFRLTATQLHSQ
nr:MAG TPA: hypothetical protein [Caudoviricetes sp.]